MWEARTIYNMSFSGAFNHAIIKSANFVLIGSHTDYELLIFLESSQEEACGLCVAHMMESNLPDAARSVHWMEAKVRRSAHKLITTIRGNN